jgi:hypothetical protein
MELLGCVTDGISRVGRWTVSRWYWQQWGKGDVSPLLNLSQELKVRERGEHRTEDVREREEESYRLLLSDGKSPCLIL